MLYLTRNLYIQNRNSSNYIFKGNVKILQLLTAAIKTYKAVSSTIVQFYTTVY